MKLLWRWTPALTFIWNLAKPLKQLFLRKYFCFNISQGIIVFTNRFVLLFSETNLSLVIYYNIIYIYIYICIYIYIYIYKIYMLLPKYVTIETELSLFSSSWKADVLSWYVIYRVLSCIEFILLWRHLMRNIQIKGQ